MLQIKTYVSESDSESASSWHVKLCSLFPGRHQTAARLQMRTSRLNSSTVLTRKSKLRGKYFSGMSSYTGLSTISSEVFCVSVIVMCAFGFTEPLKCSCCYRVHTASDHFHQTSSFTVTRCPSLTRIVLVSTWRMFAKHTKLKCPTSRH